LSRDPEYYRRLPYRRVAELREEGGERYYLARLAEIPALGGDGESEEEALRSLDETFEAYLAVCLEEGLDIPQPITSRGAALGR
jgi:predicted RNase H-like HicB family nuclease